jgi:hypothetical protein
MQFEIIDQCIETVEEFLPWCIPTGKKIQTDVQIPHRVQTVYYFMTLQRSMNYVQFTNLCWGRRQG